MTAGCTISWEAEDHGGTEDGHVVEVFRGAHSGRIVVKVTPPGGKPWMTRAEDLQDARKAAEMLVEEARNGPKAESPS